MGSNRTTGHVAMTIDAEWFEIFLSESPEAFGPTCAFDPSVGFIDGQIKLMANSTDSWEQFLLKQFVDPIEFLCRSGAEIVILAFDDAAHVPRAKAITQLKRREKIQPLDIHGWPDAPPKPWIAAMCNSQFKARVIEYVVHTLPMYLKLSFRTVIIDYNGATYKHVTYIDPNDWWVEDVERTVFLGEADVKFLWWAKLLKQPMAVISIDGDYVPIAMALDCPVCIFRHCWIHVNKLRSHLQLSPSELILLVALTGCDFSRKLPWIKPKKLYERIKDLRPALDCVSRNFDESTGMQLVASLYKGKFPKAPASASFAGVRKALLNSSLAQSTKNALPSEEQVRCTLKNARFLLTYWSDPTALSADLAQYGFRDSNGTITWDDI